MAIFGYLEVMALASNWLTDLDGQISAYASINGARGQLFLPLKTTKDIKRSMNTSGQGGHVSCFEMAIY